MRSSMAKSPSEVERRAIAAGFSIMKRRIYRGPVCANPNCVAQVSNEGESCPQHTGGGNMDKSDEKGKFRGYTRSNISDRPVRQAKNKAWSVSRKVQRGRTQRRYNRNKSRGNVRPSMRRQLGAGGKRASTKR
jgi:hypothetical protein